MNRPHELPRPVPSSGTRHQAVSLRLASALMRHAGARNLGQVLQAPCDVVLSRELVIQPDILFVERCRRGLIAKTCVHGAPDLVIEILSRNTREKDLGTKRKIYSRFAVSEYWIADPEAANIEVLLWSELGYATAGVYRKGDRLSSPALPELKLPVRKVFE